MSSKKAKQFLEGEVGSEQFLAKEQSLEELSVDKLNAMLISLQDGLNELRNLQQATNFERQLRNLISLTTISEGRDALDILQDGDFDPFQVIRSINSKWAEKLETVNVSSNDLLRVFRDLEDIYASLIDRVRNELARKR